MLILERPWRTQPQFAVGIDWGNTITLGLQQAVVSIGSRPVQVFGSSLTVNGTIGSAITGRGLAFTNSGENVSGGTASNFLSLPVTSSAVSVLYVGGRFSTPTASRVAVATCTRSTSEAAGFELDLGNAFGNANLLYWYPLGAGSNPLVFVDGVKATGNNPTDKTIVNGRIYAIVVSLASHTVGTGHTVLAKAAGTSDYAFDVGALVYATWDRQLSEAESISISANPWQLFQPRRIYIPTAAAAGSAPSITALSAIGITATSAQPRISYS